MACANAGTAKHLAKLYSNNANAWLLKSVFCTPKQEMLADFIISQGSPGGISSKSASLILRRVWRFRGTGS